jgi:acetylornithine aminotransferase
VRGAGLLIGIELGSDTAQEITQKLLDRGVLVNAANATTIRIAPALIVSDAQIKKFINIFREVLSHGN